MITLLVLAALLLAAVVGGWLVARRTDADVESVRREPTSDELAETLGGVSAAQVWGGQ